MESTDDVILRKDLENIVVNNEDILRKFNDKAIYITGVSGFIGSLLAKTFLCYNRMKSGNVKIYGLARNKDKIKKIFGDNLNNDKLVFIYEDIVNIKGLPEDINYVFHCASVTQSKKFVNEPVETINTAYIGCKNILEFGNSVDIEGIVYLSSLEVYGYVKDGLMGIKENDFGYIDINNVRSSYSEGKRICECLCNSYAKEYNLPVKIARLTQTFGAGIEYNDSRVFAEFAKCIIEKRDIILHTEGKTVRNYCYSSDAIVALLYIALYGEKGEAYNVANKETLISIKEMAEMLIKEFANGKTKLIYEIEKLEKFGYNQEIQINLNTEKLEKLGWKSTIYLKEMYRRLIESMSKRNKK